MVPVESARPAAPAAVRAAGVELDQIIDVLHLDAATPRRRNAGRCSILRVALAVRKPTMASRAPRHTLRQLSTETFLRHAELHQSRHVPDFDLAFPMIGINGSDVVVSALAAPLSLPFIHDPLQARS